MTIPRVLADLPHPVLVVDDEALSRLLMQVVLERSGATVRAADGVRAALAICGETPLSLIISGHMMPKFTGLDLLITVRGMPEFATLPFGLVSASHDYVPYYGRQYGATGFLAKPFDPRTFLEWAQVLIAIPDTWHGPSEAEVNKWFDATRRIHGTASFNVWLEKKRPRGVQ